MKPSGRDLIARLEFKKSEQEMINNFSIRCIKSMRANHQLEEITEAEFRTNIDITDKNSFLNRLLFSNFTTSTNPC